MSVTVALLALLIELAGGYPDKLVAAIGHPVIWVGRLIGLLDTSLNHDSSPDASRRVAGVFALAVIVAVAAVIAAVLERGLLRASIRPLFCGTGGEHPDRAAQPLRSCGTGGRRARS